MNYKTSLLDFIDNCSLFVENTMNGMAFHCVAAKSSNLKTKLLTERKRKYRQQKKNENGKIKERKSHFWFIFKGVLRLLLYKIKNNKNILCGLTHQFSPSLLTKITSKYAIFTSYIIPSA